MSRCSRPVLLALAAYAACLQARADDGASLAVPSAHARFSVERVRFPGGGPRVGLVGTSYLVDVAGDSGLSLGPAVYGAVSGGHGGFFTLGGEAAWRHRLAGPFGVELGLFAGGGGGGRTPAGSGLMLRPHADLVWDLGGIALGVSLSHVRYSSGQIGSTQLGLVVNASNDFRFVPAEKIGQPVLARGRAGLGFDRVQLVGGVYRTPAGKTLLDGRPLPRSIGLVGVRAEQAWGSSGFWGVEANRAVRGGVGGYAEYLGTVGLENELLRDHLTVGGRIAVGMGGGGGVSTGGGLLAKASLYGIVRLTNELGLALEAGVARAPNGNFRAAQGSASLVWALDAPDGGSLAARPARTDFGVGAVRFEAPRSDGGERALETVALKLDRFLTANFYATGQIQGAAGGGASGYSAALAGVGWNQPLGGRWHVGAELSAGAAGGGGVQSGGILVQPRVFAGVQLTPALALRVGAGRLKATRGSLDSHQIDAALVFTYGVPTGR